MRRKGQPVLSQHQKNHSRWALMLLYWYHRLTGASKTQAQWRVRSFVEAPQKLAGQLQHEGKRAVESRFHCACGQLLTRSDRTCFKCGRGQYQPYGLRVAERILKRVAPGGNIATMVIITTILIGYLIQLRVEGLEGGGPRDFPWSLYALGASFPDLLMGGQLWRGIAYSWLHGGVWHILMNTIVVYQIVPLAEQVYGSARVFLAWWLSALAGAVLPVVILGMAAPVVGASGANFGIMGMVMVFGHRLGTTQGKQLRDNMILWAVLSTVFGFSGGMNVAHGAHFGGLFTGLLLSFLLPPPKTATQRRLNPLIAILSTLIFAWGVLSTVQWMSSDYRPPKTLTTVQQARYMYGIGRVRGDADVLGESVSNFLDDVRRFKKTQSDEEERALLHRRNQLLENLSSAQRLVFEARIAEILEVVD